MSLVWEFQVDGVFHEAEWSNGSMRCTIPTVQPIVDRLIAEGYKLPCGSGVIMVEPNLDNEAGAYAVISEAVFLVADFQTILNPQSEATIGDDLIFPDANDIEKASFGGDRSAAGRHAAQIRWGNRGKNEGGNDYSSFVGTKEAERFALEFTYNHSTFKNAAAGLTGQTDTFGIDWDEEDDTWERATMSQPQIFSSMKSGMLAINDSPIPEQPLHRGMSLRSDSDGNLMFGGKPLVVGRTLSEPVASWTTDKSVADDFAVGNLTGTGLGASASASPVVLTVRNAPALPFSQCLPSQSRQGIVKKADEHLISGNLEVTGISKKNGVTHVELSYKAPIATNAEIRATTLMRIPDRPWTNGGSPQKMLMSSSEGGKAGDAVKMTGDRNPVGVSENTQWHTIPFPFPYNTPYAIDGPKSKYGTPKHRQIASLWENVIEDDGYGDDDGRSRNRGGVLPAGWLNVEGMESVA